MGHPKKQRRKYSRPKHLFKGREGERELVQAYGLKNMKELWKAKSEVSRIRSLAREMLAKPDEKKESEVLAKLKKIGMLIKEGKLDDVLKLTVENLLDRRLQTLVFKRSLTTTVKQARQDIIHGHIAIAGRRMTAPGHITTLEEGEKIDFYMNSPLANPEHPVRKIEKKASTEGAEKRIEKKIEPKIEKPAIIKEVIDEAIVDDIVLETPGDEEEESEETKA